MATLNTLKLRKIKPRFRHALDKDDKPIVHETPGRSFFRSKGAKHTYRMKHTPKDDKDSDYILVHTTQEPPWTRKRRNRRRNKAARASRKRNR